MYIIIYRIMITYIYKSNSKNISIIQNKTAKEEQINKKQRGETENKILKW